jgi:hypothetical protein
VAAGSHGIGVVFLEDVNGVASLGLSTFNTLGQRLQTFHDVGHGTTVQWDSAPGIAALPDGSYVVAWTDFDGDGDELGVVMRKVTLGQELPLGDLVRVNTSTEFSQYRSDIVWSGSELVLSWTDNSDAFSGPDLKVRRFSDSLSPNSSEMTLAQQDGAEGDVVVAAYPGSYAAAWRDAFGGAENVHVMAASASWTLSPAWAGPAEEPPALLTLDDSHLVVFFSEGVDADNDGVAESFQVSGTVVEIGAEAPVFSVTLAVPGLLASAREPSIAEVGTRRFVSWRTEALTGDPAGDDNWLAELTWQASEKALLVGTPVALPREAAHRVGDQRRPALAAASYWPEGALAAVWSDFSGSWGEPPQPVHEEVVVELIPLPIVRAE